MHITTFPAIQRRTSPTPIESTPRFLISGISRLAVKASKYCQYLNLKDLCLYYITVLRNFLWMFEVLRDWSQTDWKPRFCGNYQHQVQMDHIPLWFLLLLFLLDPHRCLHKQCCVFVFPAHVISLPGEPVRLLDVSDSEFVRFRREVVLFHCSYY